MFHPRGKSALLIATALVLAACAGPANNAATSASQPPTAESINAPVTPSSSAAQPTSAAPAATQSAVSSRAVKSIIGAMTEPAVVQTADASTSAQPVEVPSTEPLKAPTPPLALAQGQVVLNLSAGNGPTQVGVGTDTSNITGVRSFRIGADGTIRLLDNVNKRILFFGQDGKRIRALAITEARDAQDFIVNTQGEVFVLDSSGSQVLRYAPNGTLAQRLPINTTIFSQGADGIMLTASQDLLVIERNQAYWVLVHQGVVVPPELQPLTKQVGTATPRSPVIFRMGTDVDGPRLLFVQPSTNQVSGGPQPMLPKEAQFFNVDRAMNLYYTDGLDRSEVNVWRILPNSTVAGGARVSLADCQRHTWRTFYVDQAGAAWTLCVNNQGAAITRYTLTDSAGQPLSEAAKQAADVAWKPNAQQRAA